MSCCIFLASLSFSTIVLAPIVGGVAGTTLLPLLVATVLAYCVTGYVRDELYHPLVKGCVGGACSILVSGGVVRGDGRGLQHSSEWEYGQGVVGGACRYGKQGVWLRNAVLVEGELGRRFKII